MKRREKIGFKQIMVITVMAAILINIIVFSMLTVINEKYDIFAKDDINEINAVSETSNSTFEGESAQEEIIECKVEITNYYTTNYPVVSIRFSLKYLDDTIIASGKRNNIFISEGEYKYLLDDVIYIGNGEYMATYTSLYLENPDNMIVTVSVNDGTLIGEAHTFYTIPNKEYNYYEDFDKYVLPFSSTRLITENDIKNLTLEQIDLAKAEIYAKHGMKFDEKDKADYFEDKPWYYINHEFTGGYYQFNVFERENIEFLTAVLSGESIFGYSNFDSIWSCLLPKSTNIIKARGTFFVHRTHVKIK